MMRDTIEKFSKTTIMLHWLIGLAIIGMIIFGIYLVDFWPAKLADGNWDMERLGYIQIHKSIGIAILVFALWRIIWRIRNGWPKAAGNYKPFEKILSKIVHWALIIGTVLLPISGIIMSHYHQHDIKFFDLFMILPKAAEKNEQLGNLGHFLHGFGGKILIAAIILHVLGALKHHIIDKDGTFKRMAGGRIDPPHVG